MIELPTAISAELASARRTSTALSWMLVGLLVASAAAMAVARYVA